MPGQGSPSSQWDQLFEEIQAGRAFTRGSKVTGAAGSLAAISLSNPAGSGKIAHVVRAYVGTDAAQSVSLFVGGAFLVNLLGKGHNMLTGAFDSLAEIRQSTNAGIGGVPIAITNTLVRSHNLVFDLWGPILDPGESYVFQADTVASVITARFDWVEYDA